MSGVLSRLQSIGGKLSGTFMNVLNRVLPPDEREEMLASLQNFAINNPKLAAFLTTQIVLTGFPLLLFATFSVTVFLFALIAALLIGVLAAVLFTVLMVGVALLVILPVVFFTTFSATFIFLLGLGGYYVLKWINEGETPDGMAIGDKLNKLTGGRMGWLIDGARKKANDGPTGVDQTPKMHGNEEDVKTPQKKAPGQNGSVKKERQESEDESKPDAGKTTSSAKETATKQGGEVHKRPAKLTNGAGNAVGGATNATGTANGAASDVAG